MRMHLFPTLALTSLGCTMLGGLCHAQKTKDLSARFATPQRIKAGDEFVGGRVMYPSPTLQDVDGDERPDLVVGDIFGSVSFASRTELADGALSYTEEKLLKDKQGEKLKFNNW